MANSPMDTREVERNIRALQKAVIEKEPASVTINILEILKRDVFPTEELLRTTKAGIIISKLKANPNKDVARIAAEIVSKWKRTIQSRPKVAAASKVMSPAPSNEPKAFRGDSSKRRWENEKVDVKRTGQQTRDACIGLLYNGLCFMSDESSNNIITKALEIEKAAFEHFRGDNAEYRAKLRSLFQNLKAVSNRELGRKVMSGEITPSKFIIMSHDELKSSHRREEDEKIHKENMKKAQVPMAEKSISDALKCGKCGQKKVSYSQAQTRSADEPMTTFCECTICGNRWKFS